MPVEFDKCRQSSGKLRTVSGPNKQYGLAAGEYMHICIDRTGKVIRGEIKKKKALAQKVGM